MGTYLGWGLQQRGNVTQNTASYVNIWTRANFCFHQSQRTCILFLECMFTTIVFSFTPFSQLAYIHMNFFAITNHLRDEVAFDGVKKHFHVLYTIFVLNAKLQYFLFEDIWRIKCYINVLIERLFQFFLLIEWICISLIFENSRFSQK